MTGPRVIAWRSSDWFHLVVVAVLVAVLAGVTTLMNVVFTVTRVEGESMLPALQPDDHLLFTRGYGTPHAGDIICFLAEENDGSTVRVIKRVIGVPGDTVEIIGDVAFVNGVSSDVAPGVRIGNVSGRLRPVAVPEGHIYVLGDNRPTSLDSRATGVVPLASVIGKGVAVILPLRRFRVIDE